MRNIIVIIKKQLKDTLKNKTILIQFILFPALTLIMENTIHVDGMPELFFTKLFSIMYIGMAPIVSVASIISEEKEKNTLRVLMMANVKPWQYLIGIGIYVWLLCIAGAGLIAVNIDKDSILYYICIMSIGFIISIFVGACIGIYANNQMTATSIVMPVMMILAFVPMIAIFNDKVSDIANIFYTQQLKYCLDQMSIADISSETSFIIILNATTFVVLFGHIFKRKGLE